MDNTKLVRKSRNTKIYITVLGAVLVVMVIIFTIGFSKGEAVAKVGSEKISKDELYDYLVDNYGAASVDTLITNKIVELEAEKEKIKVTDEEKEKELQALMESYGGEETFNLTLEQSGMTQEDVTKEINHIITIKKLLEPRINITDEEIKTYFDENKETLGTEEQPAVYEEHVEEIKDILYDEKVETEYTTWLDEKNSDYQIENLLSDTN
jgi:foldase protein PrsA